MVRGVVYDKVAEPVLQTGVIYDNIDFSSFSLPGEVWLPITGAVVPNVQPYYYISNFGRLYSTMYKNGAGGIREINPDKKTGYRGTTLSTIPEGDNTYDKASVRLNRLVMMTFAPEMDRDMSKLVVNHKNGVKHKDELSNLEWCTEQENIQHAYDTGLNKPNKGEKHHSAKHTDEQIHKICEGLEKGLDLTETAIYAGMEPTYENRKYISRIKRGDMWTHISCLYNIPQERYTINTASLTDLETHEICLLMEQGFTNSEIADKLIPDRKGKDRYRYLHVLNELRERRTYKYVSKYYNF